MTGIADETVGVVGAGTMGSGIAQVAAWAGHPVALYDVSADQVERGLAAISGFLEGGVERGKHSAARAAACLELVRGTTVLADLAGAGVVVEAAPEQLDLKRDVFARLEDVVGGDALLATNTSTLSVAAIFARLRQPGRALGMHFFNPAQVMPLVEVVAGPATAPDAVAAAAERARAWGKHPIVAADTPGFVVNRVARPFYLEAMRMLGDRVADAPTIDRLARDAGFPMGPFELVDLIGADVNLAAAESVFDGFFGEPRLRPHPIQRSMVESGRLGRKTGRGFYDYGGPA